MKTNKNKFEYFVYYIFPLLTLSLCLIGNSFGYMVMKREKLFKIGPRNMYKYLFCTGLINSFLIIQFYLTGLDINISIISNIGCKLIAYYGYVVSSMSPMLLLYITIERFISIRYPSKKLFLRKQRTQLGYLVLLIIFNLLIYSWVPLKYSLIDKRNTTNKLIQNYNVNNNLECVLEDLSPFLVWIIGGKLIPNLMMITFTSLLIHTIFKSRRRVIANYTFNQNETYRKDLKFALTSLLLNLFFILLNLPVSFIYNLELSQPVLFLFFLYVYFLSFSLHFYFILFSNSLVRKEFLAIFNCNCETLTYNFKFFNTYNIVFEISYFK